MSLTQPASLRVAIYARVSTSDQDCSNQLHELRRFAQARGWTVAAEYVDRGISGSTTSRPQLDAMLSAARRRRCDGILVWRLDRLGRSLHHLITLMDEISSLGVAFTSLGESIDTTTPAGRLQLHLLGAFAQFERERIRERVHAGIARARRQGKRLGRRRSSPLPDGVREGLTVRDAARLWQCSKSQAARRLSSGKVPPQEGMSESQGR